MNTALAEHAQRTINQGSGSFAAAARLFAPADRDSVILLYTWCRHCDDVIDGQSLGFATGSTPGSTLAFAELERQTRAVYSGATAESPAFAALQTVIAQHALPQDWPLAHLQGFAMDVVEYRYETIDDTLAYCYHVAGVVGLMMAWIMGARESWALDRACDLGIAFQLTNIARDIVDDAVADRCYLPRRWLERQGIDPEALTAPAQRPALAELARELVVLADEYYRSAAGGLRALPPRSAWAVAAAHRIYRQIGTRVVGLGPRAWDRRVSTGAGAKLVLLSLGAGDVLRSRLQRPAPRPAHLWTRPPTTAAAGVDHA